MRIKLKKELPGVKAGTVLKYENGNFMLNQDGVSLELLRIIESTLEYNNKNWIEGVNKVLDK